MIAVHTMLGASAPIRALERGIASAARSQAKVLLTGETGVGKEVVARLIHDRSSRSSRPFVTLNCAGVPDTLLESELFGHARGSFTDAHRDSPGLLRQADKGTIFLDEIGEMSLRMQALLLRFLETGEIETVGGTAVRSRVDVRVIAATHRDLAAAASAGEFRQDLYYRLDVLHLTIPPLRERGSDVELLLRHYLAVSTAEYQAPERVLSEGALELLKQHSWPGNVRELRNVAERLVLRGAAPTIDDVEAMAAITGDSRSRADEAKSARQANVACMLDQIVAGRESFWTAVYLPFMAHDLTRSELRLLVRAGLGRTRGSYRRLVSLFNMPPIDYKRFMGFLRQHECHVPARGAVGQPLA